MDRLSPRTYPFATVAYLALLVVVSCAVFNFTGWGLGSATGRATRYSGGLGRSQVSSLKPSDVLPQRVSRSLAHVDQCNFCQSCQIGGSRRGGGGVGRRRTARKLAAVSGEDVKGVPTIVRPLQLFRSSSKSNFPNCTECYGCDHELKYLDSSLKFFNSTFSLDHGISSAQLFQASDPLLPPSNKTNIVKLWCVEVWDEEDEEVPECEPDHANEKIPVSVAVQKIAEECGFMEIISKTWVAPVNGIVPGSGFHVQWDGLWSEKADGVSLSKMLSGGYPRLNADIILDLFSKKINKTEVILASIFDLLVCQTDRHDENLFIDESGHLTLIDNDEAFGRGWRSVGVDSLFLPTTQYYMSSHVGMNYLRKKHDSPRKYPEPSILLDYRCSAPGGKIGFDYPPQVEKCLRKFATMSPEELKENYSLLGMIDAEMLFNRTRDLLRKGFEWTLEYGEPRSLSPLRYPWGTPCCSMRPVDDSPGYVECTDPNYERNLTRPRGDPKYGGIFDS
ncbi:hypothetical protein BSKO_13778 [Bryopsis sp. KO-2023]|nr:hypothetical protein BSKO_13778 [Bryopsis sp. KO-2023]